MKNYIYALIEEGYYDERFNFVKINKKDKMKVIQYINDLEKICNDDIKILAFIDDIEKVHKDIEFYLTDIKDYHYHHVIEQLEYINELKEKHCLYEKQRELEKMLDYKFEDVL